MQVLWAFRLALAPRQARFLVRYEQSLRQLRPPMGLGLSEPGLSRCREPRFEPQGEA